MTVQFNDMITTIKRNKNMFVIIFESKKAIYNNKATELKNKYYKLVII